MFTIMKNKKYVVDYSDGNKFTSNYAKAEKYSSKKCATIAAQKYGKENGNGYYVVRI